MISCTVKENGMGHLTVTFDDGTNIYIQSDYDRCQFGVDCGVITAPDDWDGEPSNLPEDWWEKDFEGITECDEHYKAFAE